MSYFWSTFIQPLYEEEENHQLPQLQRKQFKQTVTTTTKSQERDPNASIPTADAFTPKYVTRRPKNVVVPPPPPPTPLIELEDGECTPTLNCVIHQPESLFNSTEIELYEGECTPTKIETKFVFENVQTDNELNKYNIQSECTPLHSTYNSPRISVDKLYLFDWEPKYTTVNGGVFKESTVNGGRVEQRVVRSLPSSPVVKRQRVPSVSLSDVQYNLQSGIQELARLQQQFEKLSIQLLDLQTNL